MATKAMSKAERQRRKREQRKMANEFDIAPTRPGKRAGRPRNADRDRETLSVVLTARCRQQGLEPTVRNQMSVMDSINHSAVGLAIKHSLTAERAMEAWPVWKAYDTAMRRYSLIVIGQPDGAKGASLEMLPDRLETEQSASVDIRSEEERHRDAVNAHALWQSHLSGIAPHDRALIELARHAHDSLWWDESLPGATHRGRQLAHALYELADVVD